MYGDLCCEWAVDDGAKSCAQSVTKEGVCICGSGSGSGESSKGGEGSDRRPVAKPVQVPSEAKKGKKDDDDDSGWKPFPPFGGWEPMVSKQVTLIRF